MKNPYYGGGGAWSVHEIAKYLAVSNDVVVINSKHPLAKNNALVHGVTYKRIGFGTLGPKIDQIIFWFLLPLYVLLEKYDIWVETFLPPVSGSFIQRFTKKPVIGVAFFLNANKMEEKYKFPFTIFENLLIRNYRYLIATNNILRKKLSNINRKATIETIPLGVDDSLINKVYKYKEKNYILYLGRIDIYNKGLDTLLEIAPNILKSNPLVNLIIAGSGDKSQEDWFKNQVKKLRLDNRVLFVGHVLEKEKFKLLSESILYIFPSRYETFGLSVLEAMASGKPVVLFDIPGFSWIPKKYVAKVPANNSYAFKQKVLTLLKNKRERQKLGRASQEFAKGFSLEKVGNKYSKFFSKVNLATHH